ncbi:MAG: hypothetical protein FWB85_04520 [Chitinispirillia bacterium]|nr:hypothetical protein [Chitinispirillia bacterium]MCL2241831.1 hypothetical protein [Chitinispirillia bacterium]
MSYTPEYLTKQLKEATDVSNDLNARLEADPDNFALEIVAHSMNEHVEEIRRDLDEATSEAALGESSDDVAIYLGKVSMLNVRGAIELELADGRVIHGRYQNDMAEKIRSIHLGDQLKCTVGSNTVIGLEPVGA